MLLQLCHDVFHNNIIIIIINKNLIIKKMKNLIRSIDIIEKMYNYM